ncbi:hypothetical protein G7Y89_g10843 [Cudoniella acicularis]|uniref:Uncharacterized protein n=1 Tax=Cudoniella acicularis TaxID=354080 RepID=A0A8H4VYL9_9HELO|nr:hypothetical protein G7Y89_g10843 [Cudoniella acicularis]
MATTSTTSSLTLAGKVAIVTGASRGIGAAIALELAKRGAKVVITYVSPSSENLAAEVVSTIENLGNGAAAIKIQADMASLNAPKKILLADFTVEDYEALLNVNVRGVFFLTQAVVPHLRQPGRIINIGSVLGRIAQPHTSIYGASKAAVDALTRSWASELGAVGHTVNSIAPGLTQTDMMDSAVKKQGARAEQVLQVQKMLTPLEHRIGKVEDIALATAMIAEPQSRWITGQSIQASGGLYMN